MNTDPLIGSDEDPTGYSEEWAEEHLGFDQDEWDSGEAAHSAVVEAHSTKFLGTIGGRLKGPPVTAHLNYRVKALARGRGIATRALVLVSERLPAEVGVERVELASTPPRRQVQERPSKPEAGDPPATRTEECTDPAK